MYNNVTISAEVDSEFELLKYLGLNKTCDFLAQEFCTFDSAIRGWRVGSCLINHFKTESERAV